MAKLWKNIVSLIASLAIAEGAGLVSDLLAGDIPAVYENLKQPPLSPPGWLFPVVWVILYALMAVAAWLIYKEEDSQEKHLALRGYWMQLLINFVWPIVFFRFGAYGAAAWMLAGLLFLVWECFLQFKAIKPIAGYLLLPYLAWLLFAMYLNVGIVVLN